ncbi:MAG: glycosyltransferase [Pleurocapsa sp. MO_226.B13]|nr:glycosyltransferase [Pleurocapsa sp. MO_226.B13]
MAIGLPVVSTDRGSVPELVEDGKSGFWCAKKMQPWLSN